MVAFVDRGLELLQPFLQTALHLSWQTWIAILFSLVAVSSFAVYATVFIIAPVPRASLKIEEQYITKHEDESISEPRPLPCWQYAYLSQKQLSGSGTNHEQSDAVEPAEVFMSLVVPAYNEQDRIKPMLQEAVEFLDRQYTSRFKSSGNKSNTSRHRKANSSVSNLSGGQKIPRDGWEIIVVSDGSTDRTQDVVLEFAQRFPEGTIRFVQLAANRGKGGAVTHGMRHVRGAYAIFADADGASKFQDLGKLVTACQAAEDAQGRAVAIGSRAHLVGSEAVVKRSKLRNFLMYSFHLLLWALTPPATSRIKDTQCGFKLFSRQSLPYIIPHMHSEGWIFDVEMLMLAESAKIPMVEVPIGWKEVGGSKLNVIWDSLGMAKGLALLRLAWGMGVYRI